MNAKNEIKAQYDRRVEEVGHHLENTTKTLTDASPVMKYFRRRKVETALNLGQFKEEGRLLEIGSNIGQYTILFAEKGFRMVASDLSGKAVDLGNKIAKELNFKNIDYVQADAEDLSRFNDESFDGVVSFSTLRYVPDLKKALKEIYRVTKRNGVAVLDFPNRYCPWFTLLKNRFGVENHIHDHFYSAKELTFLFKEAGFCNIKPRKIMFTHYTFPAKLLGLYRLIDSMGEHTPFIKETAAIIVCKGVKA